MGDELHDLPDLSKLLNDGIVHILPPVSLGFRAVSLSEIGINASATLGAWSLP